MGGLGSGRRLGFRKRTVEACVALKIQTIVRAGLLQGFGGASTITWRDPAGAPIFSCDVRVERLSFSWVLLRLVYTVPATGEAVDLTVPLVTTCPPRSGSRWWFTCPLGTWVAGPSGGAWRGCERRVGRLYLPPRKRAFGCRRCHNLTYRSTQTSGTWLARLLG